MKPDLLVLEYESTRGFLRGLPDNEVLMLVGRLATEYVVRKEGSADSEAVLFESVGAYVGIARAVLDAQRVVLGGLTPGAAS